METESLAPYVAAEIRAEMGRQTVTSAALAMRLGKPKQTVHRWTAGQTPISIDDLDAICAALNLGVGELLTAAESRRPKVLLPHLDSNQEPAGLLDAAGHPVAPSHLGSTAHPAQSRAA